MVDSHRGVTPKRRLGTKGDAESCRLNHGTVIGAVADRHRQSHRNAAGGGSLPQRIGLAVAPQNGTDQAAGQRAIDNFHIVGHVLVHSQHVADKRRKGAKAAGDDHGMGAFSPHRIDERPRAGHKADGTRGLEVAFRRKPPHQRDAFLERCFEVDLAQDRPRRDGGDFLAQSRYARDLVDDLVLDQCRVHVGGEQSLAAALGLLDRGVDGQGAERNARRTFCSLRCQTVEREIAGNAFGQHIDRAHRAPAGAQRRRNIRGNAMVEDRTGRIGNQSQDMAHGATLRNGQGYGNGPGPASSGALKPAVIIAGPTASGKSACALAVARAFNGVVINADAMQIYSELSILTARPGPDELAAAPHRLYGALSMREPASAGIWRGLAMAETKAACDSGKLPVLVGGTGLYLRTLLSGLAPVPAVAASVRAEVQALYDRLGRDAFRAELIRRDPGIGEPPADKQRLIRAFEVLAATGRPLRDWQREESGGATSEYRYARILLDPPRDALYAAIERRFDRMLEKGALAEARQVAALGLDPNLPAMKTVGLKELLAHLRGETTLAEAVARAKQATRNYAKRQVTWFRHQFAPDLRIAAQFSESLEQEIFSFIRQFLLTPVL